jgi:4-hydroxybenzoate polyprenyltransferase
LSAPATAAPPLSAEGSAGAPAGGLRYLLALSRPRFWLYLAGPVLVGSAFGAAAPAALVRPFPLLLFLYFLLPANVLLYGVNDRFDAEADRLNPRKRGQEQRYRPGRLPGAAIAVSALLGVALALAAPAPSRPWLAGFLVLAVAYSAPPRLKTRPPLDSLSNGLYILPGGAAYAALAGQPPPAAAVVGGWLWTMAMHTYSALPDIGPDRRAGLRTTATVLGASGTLAYCGLLWLAAAGLLGALAAPLGLLLLAYPLALAVQAVRGTAPARAYRWYPALNTAVGAALTIAGLARLTGPWP